MLLTALLLSTLAVQQPAQQPTAAPAKPRANATQQADTSKAKPHRARRHKAKATTAPAPAPAPRDTTKKP
ncbi:MAG TPA: hypothetical protein VGQ29_14505 [Gemmatimonadales bacterium]|jgi:hypothetical protein|nr:hypothetical protein [Gemmatimonadales bacterium]